MKEFRRKQKKLYKIMKALIIFGAIFIFIYIGAQPYVKELSSIAAFICSYICDILVVANLALVFTYYSKYGKSDKFLETIEYELSDYGYYVTARKDNSEKDFIASIQQDFKNDGYTVSTQLEIDELDFAVTAFKRKEFFYVTDVKELSRSDILAYIDIVLNDITVHNLKRKGNAVICFVTDKAQEDAIALSKMITPVGKKEQLKIAIAIVQPSDSKCYFLGNMQTKCQQMIANYVLRCAIPIADEYNGERRLPFQDELEKHMADFNIRDFKNGTFYAH